jgi:DNA-binding LytR/AlgR family response regulator
MFESLQPNSEGRIHLKTGGKILFVPLKSIYWLESAGDYVKVFIGKQREKFLVRETLSSFEERLNGRCFRTYSSLRYREYRADSRDAPCLYRLIPCDLGQQKAF